jgi:hypothetical protein
LGYEVIVDHEESGRAYIKGFLKKPKRFANKNVNILKESAGMR